MFVYRMLSEVSFLLVDNHYVELHDFQSIKH